MAEREACIWHLSGPLVRHPVFFRESDSRRITEKLSGKVERRGTQKREQLWRRVRQMNDEVWLFANAPVSDRSSTLPAKDEWLSVDKKAPSLSPGWIWYSARSSRLFFTSPSAGFYFKLQLCLLTDIQSVNGLHHRQIKTVFLCVTVFDAFQIQMLKWSIVSFVSFKSFCVSLLSAL